MTRNVKATGRPDADLLQQLVFARVVWKRWWRIALPAGVLCAAIAFAAVLFCQPETYTSTAVIRIKSMAPFLAFDDTEPTGNYVATQLQIMRTRAVLSPAFERLTEESMDLLIDVDLSGTAPTDWMNRSLKAEVVARSELVQVSFTADTAELAQRALEAVLDSYLGYTRAADQRVDDRVIELLSSESSVMQENVNALRQQLLQQVEQSELVLAQEEVDRRRSKTGAIDAAYYQAEMEVFELGAKLQAEREIQKQNSGGSDLELELAIKADPEVRAMRKRIAQIDTDLSRLRRTVKNPAYLAQRAQQAEASRTELRGELETLQSQLRSEYSERIAVVQQERIGALTRDLAYKKTIRDQLYEEMNSRLSAFQGRKNKSQVDFEFKKEELIRKEDILDRVSDRIVALKTERRAPHRVDRIDPPNRPRGEKNYRNPAIAAIGFAVAPLGLAFLYERLSNRICNSQTIELSTTVPVLGETVRMPQYIEAGTQGMSKSSARHRQLASYRESVSNLVGLLRLGSTALAETGRVTAVLSAMSNEGKSSFALQFAMNLSRAGKRTIIVEGDLRAPDLGGRLGCSHSVGFADIVKGRASVADAVVRFEDQTPSGGFDVLLAGDTATLDLPLDIEAVKRMFEQLRQEYDHIVVDTSPILSTNEALVIARVVDSCVVCTMAGHSCVPHLTKALSLLQQIGAHPEGIVLNGVPQSSYYKAYGTYPLRNASESV